MEWTRLPWRQLRESWKTLGTLIRAFYNHYIGRLDAFRFVYCQSQLYSGNAAELDQDTIQKEINPRTRHLFDVLESRIADSTASKSQRIRMRKLAFTASTRSMTRWFIPTRTYWTLCRQYSMARQLNG